MNPTSVRLELTVPLDRTWLEARAGRRGVPIDQVMGELVELLECRAADSVALVDGVLMSSVRVQSLLAFKRTR